MKTQNGAPRWMSVVLWLAAGYNLLWGGWVVLFPQVMFTMFGMTPPNYPSLWQCVGMIVGVYGVGYACAATNPIRYWPIVMVGLLGKILGPIGFVIAALQRDLPWRFGLLNVFNDLIWWAPFTAILYLTWKAEGLNKIQQ